MRKFVFFFYILIYSMLFSNIIEVDINGTTQYQEIQSGINATVNGDTVLVHPGTYFENLIIENKSIVLASFEFVTGDSTYIENTVIDGDQNGSCIYAENFTNGIIQGFTIQNGSGYEDNYFVGGGMYIFESDISIKKCIIYNNISDLGGGCLFYYSTAYLYGNSIFKNHSLLNGGGICIGIESTVTFNTNNLNSIYLNTSGIANDIWLSSNANIVLEKFTVSDPDISFISSNGASYSFSCNQAAISQVPNDLYVNPNGSDNNNGLTPDDPLKTIAFANVLIQADSLNSHTIYVADGLYSNNTTGDHFPVNLKSYVSILGESEENTILDGDNYYPIMTGMDGEKEIEIENFTFQNSQLASRHRAPLRFCYAEIDNEWCRFTVSIENVTIKNVSPRTLDDAPNAISFIDGDRINLKNITIEDNICGRTANFWTMNLEAENLIVKNNHYLGGSEHCYGWALTVIRHNSFSVFPNDEPVILKNLLLVNNESIGDIFFPPLCFFVAAGSEAYVVNGTFSNNTIYGGNSGIIRVDDESELTLINSVVHDNEGVPVYISGDDAELTVEHCLLTNGCDDIHIVGDPTVNWLEGNLSGNPQFQGEGSELPYNYLSMSPCIDSGTINLLAGIELPQYDLSGNPRIYGTDIDMGAYEWQGVGLINNEINYSRYSTFNYPNPFNPNTTISFSIQNDSNVTLSILNIKGQKVTTLINEHLSKGKHSIIWSGCDQNGHQVSSGIYFYKLKVGNQESVKRMLLLK